SFGLGLEPRLSLIKFSDHCHLLLRCDETLNLPLGEPDLFHPRHTPRPLRACRERPRDRRASEQRHELATLQITSSATAFIHARVTPPEEERRRTVPLCSSLLAWERRHERHHPARQHC